MGEHARFRPRDAGALLRDTLKAWLADDGPRHAAGLAYYSLFTIGPLLLLLLEVGGRLAGPERVAAVLVEGVRGLAGQASAQAVQGLLASTAKPLSGAPGTLLVAATFLVGIVAVSRHLRYALNTVWEIAPAPRRGFARAVKDDLLCLATLLGTGFLLLVTFILSAGLAAMGRYLAVQAPAAAPLWIVLDTLLFFAAVMLLFALAYRFIPAAIVRWRDVLVGAAVAAALFTAGKFALEAVLARGTLESAYGVARALVVVLAWVYYAGASLFFGAELTQVYANRYGAPIAPGPGARSLLEDAAAREEEPHREGRGGAGRPS